MSVGRGRDTLPRGNQSDYTRAELYNGRMTLHERKHMGISRLCLDWGRVVCASCGVSFPAGCTRNCAHCRLKCPCHDERGECEPSA